MSHLPAQFLGHYSLRCRIVKAKVRIAKAKVRIVKVKVRIVKAKLVLKY